MQNNPPKYKMGIKEILILFLGFIIGQALVAGVGLFMLFVLHQNFESSSTFMIFAYLVSMLFPILAFDFLICRPSGRPLNFNFSTKPFYTYFLSFGMMIGMMLIADYATNLIPTSGKIFGPIYESFRQQMGSLSLEIPSMILMTVCFAPLLEEIVFRGIIYKGMENSGVRPWVAILVSAFVFGAIHFYPWQFLGAGLLGIVLALVYWKTKSLLLPIILHAFNNLVSCFLIINLKTENFSEAVGIPSWVLFLTGLVIFGIFLFLFLKKYRVYHRDILV